MNAPSAGLAMTILLFLASFLSALGVDLTGTVKGETGAPIPGTRVSIWTASVKEGFSSLCPFCYLDCGKSVLTDATGSFVLHPVDATLRFNLLVAKSGYAPRVVDGVDGTKPVAIFLRARPESALQGKNLLRGRVVDADGKPVPSAMVEPVGFVSKSGRQYGGVKSDPMALTDEEGNFILLVGDAQYTACEVTVTARGFASANFSALAFNQSHDLKLNVGATVSGLLHRDGQPVKGARIGLVSQERASNQFIPEVVIGTDDTGRFTFTNVPAERLYYVYPMRTDAMADRVAASSTVATGKPGTRADAGTLDLIPGVVTEGKIDLREGGKVLPQTRLTLDRETAWDAQQVVVSEDGTFRFRAAPDEIYSFNARIPGYTISPKTESWDAGNRQVQFRIGSKPRITLSYYREGEAAPGKRFVKGRLLDPAGQPVEGARYSVQTVPHDRNYQGWVEQEDQLWAGVDASPKTGKDGVFSIPVPVEGVSWILFHSPESGYLALRATEVTGEVRLLPWCQVKGRALLGGKPMKGLKITLVQPKAFGVSAGAIDSRAYLKTETDAEGRFRFERVSAGFCQVSREVESADLDGMPVLATPGTVAEVTLGEEGATISGNLGIPQDALDRIDFHNSQLGLDAMARESPPTQEGRASHVPAEDWYPTWSQLPEGLAYHRKFRPMQAAVKRDGSFRFENVPAGRYNIRGSFRAIGSNDPVSEGGDVALVEVTTTQAGQGATVTAPPLKLRLERVWKPGEAVPALDFTYGKDGKFTSANLLGHVTIFQSDFFDEGDMKEASGVLLSTYRTLPSLGKLQWFTLNTARGMDKVQSAWTNPWPMILYPASGTIQTSLGISHDRWSLAIGPDGKVLAAGVNVQEVLPDVVKTLKALP